MSITSEKNLYTTVMNHAIYASNQLKIQLYTARFIEYEVQKAQATSLYLT